MGTTGRVTVSAIVATRNVADYVGAALESILAQTRPPDEVVVVDGGSTDGTRRVVAQFPGVRVVHQPDEGLAAARNLALAETSGSMVAFLDADDEWSPAKTEQQLDALAADPSSALVAGHMLREQVVPDGSTVTETVPALTPGGVLVRRSVFAVAGGFDERYRIAGDTEWFMRVRDAGLATLLFPDIVLAKGSRPGQLSGDATRYRAELLQATRARVHRLERHAAER